MNIVIENCSSPGASFTENTQFVMWACYDWIIKNPQGLDKFVTFRKTVAKKYKFNDNNARNIFPLLKNCGFVKYEQGGHIEYDDFFTKEGLAYVKCLDTLKVYDEIPELKQADLIAIEKFRALITEIVYRGLIRMVKSQANYSLIFLKCAECLLRYEQFSKFEFSYLLYLLDKYPDGNVFSKLDEFISKYRAGELELNVEVKVRNDTEIRKKSGKEYRNEGIDYLTSFTYFGSLFKQAGLVKITKQGMTSVSSEKENIEKLVEEYYYG